MAITVTEVNTAPVFAAIAPQVITETETLNFTANATDSDLPAQTLTYGLFSGPVGVGVDSNSGEVSWIPGETETMGVITLIVSDTYGLTDTTTVLVTVLEANSAPTLGAIGTQNIDVGDVLTFTAVATDTDVPANALTYSLASDVPAGANINPATGVFNWTPTVGSVYTVTVQVSDDGVLVLTDTTDVRIEVGAANLSITKTVEPQTLLRPGDPVTFTIVISNSGSGNAGNVRVWDTLPVRLSGTDLDWSGTVTAGESIIFTLPAAVANNAGYGATITNTAAFSYTFGNGSADAVIQTKPEYAACLC